MGRRARPCGCVGGGDRIPALGKSGARVAQALGALALAAGVVAYAAGAGDRHVIVVAVVGTAGWALLVPALLAGWPVLVFWGVAGVGASYAIFLRLREGGVDARAPIVAAALLAVTELCFLSLRRERGRLDRDLRVRTALLFTGAVAASAVVGGVVLVVAGSARSGLALEGLGAAAAVLALAVVALVASRPRDQARREV